MPHQAIQITQERIKIILIGGSQDEANQYVTTLRDKGQAAEIVTLSHINHLADELIQTAPYHFLLINDSADLDIKQIVQTAQQQTATTSILLLSKEPEKYLDGILQLGIRDIIHPANSLHLSFAILRERQVQQQQQTLEFTEKRLQNTADRLSKLQENSQDAIAHVHAGMHIDANTHYCKLFSIPTEDILAYTFRDLLSEKGSQTFLDIERDLSKQNDPQKPLPADIECRSQQGNVFTQNMLFYKATIDEEACIQIVIPSSSNQPTNKQTTDHSDLQLEPSDSPAKPQNKRTPKKKITPPKQQKLPTWIQQAFKHDHFQLLYQAMLAQKKQAADQYVISWQLTDEAEEAQLTKLLENKAAQNADLTHKLDTWLLDKALQSLVEQQQPARSAHFHIELSSPINPKSTTVILNALKKHTATNRYLTLQFSEKNLRAELSSAQKLIEKLHHLGCTVAITQFNNSQGSQQMLDYLKIDIVRFADNWTQHIRQNESQQQALNKINQQLQKSSIQTMVTGVTDAETLALLWNMGFDYLLGDFIQPVQKKIVYRPI